MKGINHERLSFLLLLPVTYLLGYQRLDQFLSALFVLLWIIGTLYITCDLDTASRSRKRLWVIGWIIDKLFKHRGYLHSPLLWAGIGIVGYYFCSWPFLGLIVPQYLHILSDWIS